MPISVVRSAITAAFHNTSSATLAFDATGCDLIIAALCTEGISNVATGIAITYAGTAVPFITGTTATVSATQVSLYGLINPTTGSNTLSASWSNNGSGDLIVCGISGTTKTIKNGTVASNSAGSTTAAVTATSAVGDLVIGALSGTTAGYTPTAAGGGTTLQFDTAQMTAALGSWPGAASVPISWTFTSQPWIIAACDVGGLGAPAIWKPLRPYLRR